MIPDYSLVDGIHQIVRNNNYELDKQQKLAYVIGRAIGELPDEIVDRCSFRLLHRGKLVEAGSTDGQYISVIIGNNLLFRAPAYTDRGSNPKEHDLFLIYPKQMLGHKLFRDISVDERNIFPFARIDCINIGLQLNDVADLSNEHWKRYKDACLMAAPIGASPGRQSNIRI